jgi:hypothetical protein
VTQHMQEQEHDQLHRGKQRHPLPLWVRWFIVLFVPLLFLSAQFFGLSKGLRLSSPLLCLLLLAFSLLFPKCFPGFSPASAMNSRQLLHHTLYYTVNLCSHLHLPPCKRILPISAKALKTSRSQPFSNLSKPLKRYI